jgi:hypothetical protein
VIRIVEQRGWGGGSVTSSRLSMSSAATLGSCDARDGEDRSSNVTQPIPAPASEGKAWSGIDRIPRSSSISRRRLRRKGDDGGRG